MSQVKRNPSVVIIGAGMTGMLMVIKLRIAGNVRVRLAAVGMCV